MKQQNLIKQGLIVGVLAMSAALPALADVDKPKATGSGPNPFSDCGIGAALFTETKWAAVTSNVIWDIGTTAVTSATASPETCSGKRVETAQFIIDNYDNIAEETARGQGEYLTSMLQVRGCEASSYNAIISEVRSEMTTVVSQPGYADKGLVEKASDMFQSVDGTIRRDFSDSCSA